MKFKAVWFIVLLGLVLLACGQQGEAPTQPADDVVNRTGGVQALGPWGFRILDDAGGAYWPENLPDQFKHDGLRVLFSGRSGPLPPGDRVPGVPLELSSIQLDIR